MIKKALDSNLNSNSLNDKQRKDFIRYFKNKEGALIFKYWNKEKIHITSLANQTPPKEKRASKLKNFYFIPCSEIAPLLHLGWHIIVAQKNIRIFLTNFLKKIIKKAYNITYPYQIKNI